MGIYIGEDRIILRNLVTNDLQDYSTPTSSSFDVRRVNDGVIEMKPSSGYTYACISTFVSVRPEHIVYIRAKCSRESASSVTENTHLELIASRSPWMEIGRVHHSCAEGWETISMRDQQKPDCYTIEFVLAPAWENNGAPASALNYFSDLIFIDLTEAFGAGSEPSKEWCDANIPNFYGTWTGPSTSDVARKVAKIYMGDVNGMSRFIQKAYIGIDGIAERVWDNAPLPKGYTKIVGLKGNGSTTYIQLDWVLNVSNCYLGVEAYVPDTATDYHSVYACENNGDPWNTVGVRAQDGRMNCQPSVSGVSGAVTPIRITIPYTQHVIASNASRYPLRLYSTNVANSSSPQQPSACTIYWVGRKNESGDIINYLVPARRNSDGVLGMYDVITGQFWTNAGSGSFTEGN